MSNPKLWFMNDSDVLDCGFEVDIVIPNDTQDKNLYLMEKQEQYSKLIQREKNLKKKNHYFFMSGNIKFALENFEEGISDLSKCLRNNGRYICCKQHKSLIYCCRGSCYLCLDRNDEALQDFQLSLKSVPGNLKTIYEYIKCLREVGCVEEAERIIMFFFQRIKEFPHIDMIVFFSQVGDFYKVMDRYEEAIKWYSLQSTLMKSCGCPLEERGFCFFQLEQYDKALRDLNHGLTCGLTNYSEIDILLLKFRCYLRRKERDDEKAYQILNIALSKTSVSCGPNERGRCHHCKRFLVTKGFIEYHKTRGEFDKALEYCEKLGLTYPEPMCHWIGEVEKGLIYDDMKGMEDKALECYLKGTEYDCDIAMLRAASIFKVRDDFEKSVKYLIKVKSTTGYERSDGQRKALIELMLSESYLLLFKFTSGILSLRIAKNILIAMDPSLLLMKDNNKKLSKVDIDILEMIKWNENFIRLGRKNKACFFCGVVPSKKCSGCLSAWYCSVDHQKKDWKEHKKLCKKR